MENNKSFYDLVAIAMREVSTPSLRPVVEKEILHYEIFSSLYKHNLLDGLVFQGGTMLRLCHGSSRFSEDLDFAGGANFSPSSKKDISSAIEEHIGKRLGLAITVKDPKNMERGTVAEGVMVDKWQITIETSPERVDIPRQRIKLEIANIPAYTIEAQPLRNNYQAVEMYPPLFVQAESLTEVMADKVFSLPISTKYIRHRDIWDLAWMKQKSVKLAPDLLRNKITDYNSSEEQYMTCLDDRIASLPDIIHGKDFISQMRRFLPNHVIKETMDKDDFNEYLIKTVSDILLAAKHDLDGTHKNKSTFKM